MTYSLINKCAKNYYNRTFIVPVIAKNVVTCFFLRHSVVRQEKALKVLKAYFTLMTESAGFLLEPDLFQTLDVGWMSKSIY